MCFTGHNVESEDVSMETEDHIAVCVKSTISIMPIMAVVSILNVLTIPLL